MNHVPRRTTVRRGPLVAALLATALGLTACADTDSGSRVRDACAFSSTATLVRPWFFAR